MLATQIQGQPVQRIIVLNSKGGCGKTTMAINLASHYACQGYSTALLDFDPQGSAMKWLSQRSQEYPAIYGVATHRRNCITQTQAWQTRIPPGTHRVVIDTPAGIMGQQLQALIRHANIILLPVLPSPIDIHAASHFIQELLLQGRVRQLGIRLGVVANRVKQNTKVYQSLERFLNTLDLPFVATLRDTQNYVHAAERGIGIVEMWDNRVVPDKSQWQSLMDWLEAAKDMESAVHQS